MTKQKHNNRIWRKIGSRKRRKTKRKKFCDSTTL